MVIKGNKKLEGGYEVSFRGNNVKTVLPESDTIVDVVADKVVGLTDEEKEHERQLIEAVENFVDLINDAPKGLDKKINWEVPNFGKGISRYESFDQFWEYKGVAQKIKYFLEYKLLNCVFKGFSNDEVLDKLSGIEGLGCFENLTSKPSKFLLTNKSHFWGEED